MCRRGRGGGTVQTWNTCKQRQLVQGEGLMTWGKSLPPSGSGPLWTWLEDLVPRLDSEIISAKLQHWVVVYSMQHSLSYFLVVYRIQHLWSKDKKRMPHFMLSSELASTRDADPGSCAFSAFEPPRLHCGELNRPPWLHFERRNLRNFDFNSDPDPAFHSHADLHLDLYSRNMRCVSMRIQIRNPCFTPLPPPGPFSLIILSSKWWGWR